MKTTKKILSIILAVIMIATAVPFALAAEEAEYVNLEYVSHCIMKEQKVITNSNFRFGGNGSENCEKLFDGNVNSKLCCLNGYWKDFFMFWDTFAVVAKTKDGTAVKLDGYEIVTANDEPQRDPDDWKFYGSEDGVTWELIDEVTDAGVTDERNSASAFELDAPSKAYAYFRFEFTALKTEYNNTKDHALQMSEIRLIEHKHSFKTETTEPTCTAEGLEKTYCEKNCGESSEKVFPALGHADEDGDGICDNGGEALKCKDCGRDLHGDTLAENLYCFIIMFFNLVKSFFG